MKKPRWVHPFLRALERTGRARTAAEDAGVDHTTAYARRRAHTEFAEAWAEALRAHADEKKRGEDEAIAAVSETSPPASLVPLPTGSAGSEELTISAGRVRRVGHGRWSNAKERIFFEELAATNNVQLAAKAAGVSPNAVHARRLRHPLFAAKWEAVVQSAKASIDLYLVEETRKAFEPETLDTAEVKPRVTIDQAIKISQLNRAKAGPAVLANPFQEHPATMGEGELDAIRERLLKKMMRLKQRDQAERMAEGWSYDERHDTIVPPGWVRD